MPRLAHHLPLALRATLLAGLIALLLAGLRQADERPRTVRLTGGTADEDRLAASLIEPVAATATLRDAGRDPAEHELQALAAAAQRAPLFVELPRESPSLRVTPPDRPLVNRVAAIRFLTTAAPGDTVTARLLDPGSAVIDTVRVVTDAAGAVRGAFRVRPGRPEWLEWRVAMEGANVVGDAAVARVGAWVADADPPRVLVVAGPPSWESRYAVRALERSGAAVSLVQTLGRDNIITAGAATEDWASEGSLGRYDVVILFPGAAVDAETMAAVETWVAAGRGVLAASAAAGRLGLGAWGGEGGASDAGGSDSGVGEPDDSRRGHRLIRADSLVWTAPAEVAPLPAAELESAVQVPSGVPTGTTVAARDDSGDPVLVVAPLGRGRVAGLGLRESWRWVMEAGLEAEHRAFWRSLVDWLAAPSADSLAMSVEPSEAAVGVTVDVALLADSLVLQRPTGEIEPIGVGRDGEARGRFVAVDTGLHLLGPRPVAADSAGGSSTALNAADGVPGAAAFRARPHQEAPPAELGRARLSLLAAASGGAALEPGPFNARVEALGATSDRTGRWLPWIFAALALLALAEWTLRRLRGLP